VRNPTKIDSLLEPLLLLSSEEQTNEFFSQIIGTHAGPVIAGVIRSKIRINSNPGLKSSESDDIHQEAVAQLLVELRRLREQPESHPISDLCGLAAVIAHRACARWMRRQYPERHALKNRLYYLFTRQRGLALWQSENRRLMAGFTAWQAGARTASPDRLAAILEDEQLMIRIRLLRRGQRHTEASEILASVLNFLGGPVEFDDLAGVLASVLDLRHSGAAEVSRDPLEMIAATQPDASWQVEKHIFLQRLWEEIQLLPVNQRRALLLALSGAEGRGCIALFPATGTASLRQLAAALEMDAEALAALWNELPLDDRRLAEILQLTRQQVVNMRKSARERLRRRLKGFF
jgi:hypothetical protein